VNSSQFFFSSTINLFNNLENLESKFIYSDLYDNEFKINKKNEILFENFLWLKKPSFISFFINNFIDVPVCFKKSFSLKNKNFELPILKFCNLLMKNGKKNKIINFFFSSLRLPDIDKEKKLNENFLYTSDLSWPVDYLSINTYFFFNSFFTQISPNFLEPEQINFLKHNFNEKEKFFDVNLFFKNEIFKEINSILPVFSYFIYSIDKNIKKFSRGKAGKYLFIWKYIPPYKRTHIVLKWIAKEIKFNTEKKFSGRIKKTFFNIKNNPESTFAWKSKTFSHNYVFRHFKKTLMESFKTTT